MGEGQAKMVAAGFSLRRLKSATTNPFLWNVGHRIRQDILKQKRAEYGEKIVSTLGRQLSAEYRQGYSDKKVLIYHNRYARTFLGENILSFFVSVLMINVGAWV